MTLPIIAAPHGSGVTQQDLNDGLVEKIEKRTTELVATIHVDADRITDTADGLLKSGDLSQMSLERFTRVVDMQLVNLAESSRQLKLRLEALVKARETATHGEITNSLAQSA